MYLSIVVPCFNEEAIISQTCEKLLGVIDDIKKPCEIIFVDDGSSDQTYNIIQNIAKKRDEIKIIQFSRNFGHQAAVIAGIEYATGDGVVLIDADLQDPPELIHQMIGKWEEGYDVIYGKRKKRHGETFFKKATAHLFYRTLRMLTSTDIPVDTGDFRLMDRTVCLALMGLKEKNPFIRGLVSWVGFKQTFVEYNREERKAGESKYPLKKMIKFASDAIFSFSYKPLELMAYIGFAISAGSFIYLLYVIYLHLFTNQTIQGWTSSIAITLLLNGITLSMIGIIGQYIRRIYEEVKDRPRYIVKNIEGNIEQIKNEKTK